jgi:hypothetical protein
MGDGAPSNGRTRGASQTTPCSTPRTTESLLGELTWADGGLPYEAKRAANGLRPMSHGKPAGFLGGILAKLTWAKESLERSESPGTCRVRRRSSIERGEGQRRPRRSSGPPRHRLAGKKQRLGNPTVDGGLVAAGRPRRALVQEALLEDEVGPCCRGSPG